jgi:undecaprenyl-diphosphatase
MHPVGEAVLLGTIQGLTEFLPVSSDGHLALAQILFGVSGSHLTLTVMLHAGTLLATLLVLRARVATAVAEGVRSVVRPARFKETPGGRDALVVILASLPTAMIGFGLRDLVERWTESPLIVGLGFVATAILLISARWAPKGSDETPSMLGALALGIAQGFAVLPGLSRSGSTITLALWLGIKPERAYELSMLMSLPAVTGALLLEAPKALSSPTGLGTAAIGSAVAFAVGIVALVILRRVLKRGAFPLFAIWVVPVALATLALARAWPH